VKVNDLKAAPGTPVQMTGDSFIQIGPRRSWRITWT